MKIKKYIEKNIKKSVFLIEYETKLNSKYFINKIEQGVFSNNLNYVTHVHGKMTSWTHFLNDAALLNLIKTSFNYLDTKIPIRKCFMREAWGNKVEYNDVVREHDHEGCVVSGVLYLNNSRQKLYFNELDEEITPKVGKIILFHPCLKHFTKPSLEKKPRYSIAFNYVEDSLWK
jgi:hypothetical protein